jgi:short-subunit dehydrogenase
MDIKDKVVLITGASAGIGLATAQLLWKDGATLALNARSTDKLNSLARELPGSEVFPADMSDENSVRELVQNVVAKFGRLDILINNAGRGMAGFLETIDIKKYRQLIELNVIGPLVAMQAAIPIMRKQGGGSIVNISSGTTLMYAPGISGYSATKRALNGLSLTVRNELAKDKISVSVVYPYITKSDFYKNLISNETGYKTAEDVAAGRAPADTSEYVAELIQTAILSGEAEIFAHDWMRTGMDTK